MVSKTARPLRQMNEKSHLHDVGEAHVVSVVTFNVTAENVVSVAEKSKKIVDEKLPLLDGFVGGEVLLQDDKTQIVVVSYWRSQHNWARAMWEKDISHAIGDLFEATGSYDVQHFSIVTSSRHIRMNG
jgi:heme-degrading monooxygenase HmoA